MSQEEFGRLLGKPQSVVSRLEDPEYGKVTLQTLLDIASKLDVALIVRFADYPTYLNVTSDVSPRALRPPRFNQREIEALAEHEIRTPASAT
jgi:transcriptional regulator with XRE-family HTH domain